MYYRRLSGDLGDEYSTRLGYYIQDNEVGHEKRNSFPSVSFVVIKPIHM